MHVWNWAEEHFHLIIWRAKLHLFNPEWFSAHTNLAWNSHTLFWRGTWQTDISVPEVSVQFEWVAPGFKSRSVKVWEKVPAASSGVQTQQELQWKPLVSRALCLRWMRGNVHAHLNGSTWMVQPEGHQGHRQLRSRPSHSHMFVSTTRPLWMLVITSCSHLSVSLLSPSTRSSNRRWKEVNYKRVRFLLKSSNEQQTHSFKIESEFYSERNSWNSSTFTA